MLTRALLKSVAWIVVAGLVHPATGREPPPATEQPPVTTRAGGPEGRFERCTYISRIDGATIDYALWYPPGYDEARRWPLIVFLHGAAEGDTWDKPTRDHVGIPVRGARSDLPALVAYPRMRGSWSITTLAEADVLDTIADVQARASVDPDRIHLTGLSLGGFAAWRVACRYPDRFATVTPFCGGGEPELAGNLRHVATRVYHGSADKRVSVKESRAIVRALEKAGLNPLYHELRDAPHVCWVKPYADPKLYEWMGAHRRVVAPRRISYRTHTLRHHRAYWASIESVIDPARPAAIDVFTPDETQVFVHCDNVARLVLDPPESVIPAGAAPAFFVNGRPAKPQRSEDGWVLTPDSSPPLAAPSPGRPAEQGASEKRPGLSGPILDVFYDPFVVVVPGSAGPAAATVWQEVASRALEWSTLLAHRNFSILSDDDVTPEIIARCHLICFGNPQTHAILNQAADGLPVTWSGNGLRVEGAKASGDITAVVMISPNPVNPDRYLVTCSGLPVAVAKLAAEVLRPPYLSRPPREDLVVMTRDGKFPLVSNMKPDPNTRRSMAAPRNPRGAVFDRSWRLTPQAKTILLAPDAQ